MKVLFIFFVCFILLSWAKPEEERVTELPEMGKFDTYGLYSGYLEIPNKQRKLHYVLAESQNDPEKDPLLVWFNGGPGCSTMLAFVQEHGPYHMPDGETTFLKNPNSWNLEANVLYIESPAGVGYSYFWGKETDFFNDTISSEDNYEALLKFYEKFPEYKSHDLFISGESYAGIYVPYLAWQLIQHNSTLNLKGILVGNGLTDYRYDLTPAFVKMGFWRALYDTKIHDEIEKYGCTFVGDDMESPECEKLFEQFENLIGDINMYDVYRECYHDDSNRIGSAMINGQLKSYKRGMTAQEYTPYLFEGKRGKLKFNPPCVYGSGPTDYLNRQDVRDALHIETDQVWELCTNRIDYDRGEKASIWIYPILKKHGIKAFHFSGNADGAVPTQGTKEWIRELGWNKTADYAPFYIENKQVGGYVEQYDGITLATIQGVGHMAAQWSPVATRYAIMQFIKGEPIPNEYTHFDTE